MKQNSRRLEYSLPTALKRRILFFSFHVMKDPSYIYIGNVSLRYYRIRIGICVGYFSAQYNRNRKLNDPDIKFPVLEVFKRHNSPY